MIADDLVVGDWWWVRPHSGGELELMQVRKRADWDRPVMWRRINRRGNLYMGAWLVKKRVDRKALPEEIMRALL